MPAEELGGWLELILTTGQADRCCRARGSDVLKVSLKFKLIGSQCGKPAAQHEIGLLQGTFYGDVNVCLKGRHKGGEICRHSDLRHGSFR